jgi:hypothetical protein
MEERDRKGHLEGELTDEEVEAHLIKEALAAGAAAGAMFAGTSAASGMMNPFPPPTPADQAQTVLENTALPQAAVTQSQAVKPKAKKAHKAKKAKKSTSAPTHVGRNTNVHEE